MPSRIDELFRPVWIRPRLGTLWRRHPPLRERPRGIRLRRGQKAFRCRAREPRRTFCLPLLATGCRQNSGTLSRRFLWIALFLTSSFVVKVLDRRSRLGSSSVLEQRRYFLIAALTFMNTPSCSKRIGTAT